MIADSVVLIHACATSAMVGVIWFVQLVHYPLMSYVTGPAFSNFETEHQRRTTWIVAPLMLVEAAAAIYILFIPQVITPAIAWLGATSLTCIWLSTFLWQVPCHRRLEEAFDAQMHKRLVQSNWLRTVLWTLRGGIACTMLNFTS